jgi:hypothetical protein
MESKDRVCEDFIVSAVVHGCLNASRHLTMLVVAAAYGRMIRKHFTEHPLNKFISLQQGPRIWRIDPGCLHIADIVYWCTCLYNISAIPSQLLFQADGTFIKDCF